MKKVVFVTDVRFWRCRTGAQQRINSLVHYLVSARCEVTVVFAAPLDDENRANDLKAIDVICDRSLIDESGLRVVSLVDDWSPTGLIEKIKWKGKCILNAMLPVDHTTESKPITKSLETLRVPEFVPRAKELLESLAPDVVIVEYVTLAYLYLQKPIANISPCWIAMTCSPNAAASFAKRVMLTGCRFLQKKSSPHFSPLIACSRSNHMKLKPFVTEPLMLTSSFAGIPSPRVVRAIRGGDSGKSAQATWWDSLPRTIPRIVMRCDGCWTRFGRSSCGRTGKFDCCWLVPFATA